MASVFTRMMSGRGVALMLGSLGAGAFATSYLRGDSAGVTAQDKTKLYPPRYPHAQESVLIHLLGTLNLF